MLSAALLLAAATAATGGKEERAHRPEPCRSTPHASLHSVEYTAGGTADYSAGDR